MVPVGSWREDGATTQGRNLKAEIDAERIEAYRDTVSLPFEPGAHKQVAVKTVDIAAPRA